MNFCTRCDSYYKFPGTCNCFAPSYGIIKIETEGPTFAPGTGNLPTFDPTTCPCHPKNGGSGVCGCIRGSQTVTCQTNPPERST